MEEKKTILSLKDVEVKFKVRGRILQAIRGVNLDIYEGESIAIVGESGSGKSVLTKTFSGMLDSNGFVSNGSIIYDDPALSETNAKKNFINNYVFNFFKKKLNAYSKFEYGKDIYNQLEELDKEVKDYEGLSGAEIEEIENKINDLDFDRIESFNKRLSLSNKTDKEEIALLKAKEKDLKNQIMALNKELKEKQKQKMLDFKNNTELREKISNERAKLNEEYAKAIDVEITEEQIKRNELIAKELILSIARYPFKKRVVAIFKILNIFKKAMKKGIDLSNPEVLDNLYSDVAFRVEYRDENEEKWMGYCKLDLAKFKLNSDWQQIRGAKVATVFQDPMTSLNPILTIGSQITDCILKHQNLTYAEAKEKAKKLMTLVGIPDAEKRFNDYPFQYSGGMRQRIVIAIALSCEPRILICDEPTTALDVTIQAQIIRLIKDLQKKLGFTIVFITHDLGVVANVADRVAVLYAGQIVEVGEVEEVFYDPRHPYTWSLLSSLPQLSTRGEELFSITGTPPSLYNKIVGDPFAPRNPYRMAIDYVKEPPMFKITETHYAKTWLLDERAPKVEKPKIIQNLHEKLTHTVYTQEESEA